MISGHWRSFHLHITVKMTNTLISGFTFGRMILVKMVNSLAPSILPASSSPSGISLINCLDKNRPFLFVKALLKEALTEKIFAIVVYFYGIIG